MKRFLLSTIAVLAATATFSQEPTKENLILKEKKVEMKQPLNIRPKGEAKKIQNVLRKKEIYSSIKRAKAQQQGREKMKPKAILITR